MTKIVQSVGGDAQTQDAYTGPDREITVDTSNWNLRLHDGSTAGGHVILSQDNADLIYQGRSVELDGIGPYTPEQRGFLVRRGAGEYRIRKVQSSTSIEVDNIDGFDGDPLIDIAPTIYGDKRFNDDVLIDRTLTVTMGVAAPDFYGIHHGSVVGPVTGNTFGVHTGTSNGQHNGLQVGTIDTRGADVIMDPGQIEVGWIENLLPYLKTNAIPIGTIVMWSGSTGSIPSGWRLCDGGGGTPDLRNKFMVGAGDDYAPGDQGGVEQLDAVSNVSGNHSHGGAVAGHTLTIGEIPSHQHAFGANVPIMGTGYGYTGVNGVTGGGISTTGFQGGGASHDHGLTINDSGDHTHHLYADNRPPYYALCFIMHMS